MKNWSWRDSSKVSHEQCLNRLSVDLRVVHLREWLRKGSPAPLLLGNMVSKVHEVGLTESPGLAFRLWTIHRFCQVFNTEKGANRCEELADEFSTFIAKDTC